MFIQEEIFAKYVLQNTLTRIQWTILIWIYIYNIYIHRSSIWLYQQQWPGPLYCETFKNILFFHPYKKINLYKLIYEIRIYGITAVSTVMFLLYVVIYVICSYYMFYFISLVICFITFICISFIGKTELCQCTLIHDLVNQPGNLREFFVARFSKPRFLVLVFDIRNQLSSSQRNGEARIVCFKRIANTSWSRFCTCL